ncbi:MAG: ATP-binding protein [Balneolaceae bacterium]|jgi:signal transduction histidine kinase
MENFLETNRLHHLLGWTLLGLLAALLALEGWRYGVKPSEVNNEQVMEESLDKAADFFLEKQQELLAHSQSLAATLRPPLIQKKPSDYLYNTLKKFPEFWSSTLYRGNQPIIWDDFALETGNSKKNHQDADISIKKYDNVIYWECHVPFSIQDSSGTIKYDLYTSYRIEQSNPLPIGDRSEFNLLNSQELSTAYPLNFSIFSTPPPEIVKSQPLLNLQGDSVGVIYATSDEFQQTKVQWEQNTRFWRSIYALLCFVILVFLLYWAADRLPLWRGLALQLLFLGIGWGIFVYTNMPTDWILALSGSSAPGWVNSVVNLSSSGINAIFALLASITLARKINLYRIRIKAEWYLSSIGLAAIAGIINALIIPVVFNIVYKSATASGIALMDLHIFPDWETIILYLELGIAILALGVFLITINRLLFRISQEHFKVSASVLATTFVISLFVTRQFFPDQLTLNWIFFSSILSFTIVTGVAAGKSQNLVWITGISPLRTIVLGSLAISLVSLPILYRSTIDHIDDELWKSAQTYSKEDDPFAAQLTEKLLTNLENKFRDISKDDLTDDRSTLQARFTQTIQGFLSPELNTYSFDLQLINTSGKLIADYSTDLNSPNWLTIFNIPTLQAVTEIQQITKSTIRPIVQKPQLVNQQNYRTFYRGWIPVFGTSDESIAWILCSIYQERPEFNKPIRAVMASLTYDDWSTPYLMQKFQNEKLVSSVQQGFAGYFPKYRTLDRDKLQALEKDSLVYLNEDFPEYSYRTLLWNKSPAQTIKISTTLPDYRAILFSFFRFSFSLLLAGCLIALLGKLLTAGRIQFLGEKKRFQDRILDSFLLATLIFLAFLIATSHYAIKQQNQDIVRQELVDKLQSLTDAVESNKAIRKNLNAGTSFSLDSLTTPLNVDATFYAGLTVTETTTPQIYQQHLLPSALPYKIFAQLFKKRQQDAYTTVNLAGQSLLIGYRSILNDENKPVATIAIPTFLESPKYDQQLLETTSYLILIYLLVFSLFILGSTFISRQLTRPLVYIQRGLNKISSGNLDTTIPVTSEDEIGNLARAYNNMVFRLKKLQRELASAEREAAWKEMAQQVAHEIKNPLTPMKLNVQHLERQLKSENQDPEELKKRVQKITNNLIEQIQSLNNIASDFSKFSQPLDEKFDQIDLTSILTSVAELYQHDEKVKVQFQSQNGSVHIQGISDELKRVFINLVKNAYEAMPDGGGEIILRLYRQQHNIFVEVEDNGSGISEEDRPNIFVPNFSTKSSGTGLGLAICKKIIEAHEGSISFASVEGEGTTFVIKLPGADKI